MLEWVLNPMTVRGHTATEEIHGRSHLTRDRNCRDSAIRQGMAEISATKELENRAGTESPEGTTFLTP